MNRPITAVQSTPAMCAQPFFAYDRLLWILFASALLCGVVSTRPAHGGVISLAVNRPDVPNIPLFDATGNLQSIISTPVGFSDIAYDTTGNLYGVAGGNVPLQGLYSISSSGSLAQVGVTFSGGADLAIHSAGIQAVPEPSSFAMMSLGLIGLVGSGWRRLREKRTS